MISKVFWVISMLGKFRISDAANFKFSLVYNVDEFCFVVFPIYNLFPKEDLLNKR